jgi:hypothetical protein
VGDGATSQSNAYPVLVGTLRALANGLGNFLRFAVANADFTFLVTHHNDSRKAEATASLDDFRTAIDEDDFLYEFGGFILSLRAIMVPV